MSAAHYEQRDCIRRDAKWRPSAAVYVPPHRRKDDCLSEEKHRTIQEAAILLQDGDQASLPKDRKPKKKASQLRNQDENRLSTSNSSNIILHEPRKRPRRRRRLSRVSNSSTQQMSLKIDPDAHVGNSATLTFCNGEKNDVQVPPMCSCSDVQLSDTSETCVLKDKIAVSVIRESSIIGTDFKNFVSDFEACTLEDRTLEVSLDTEHSASVPAVSDLHEQNSLDNVVNDVLEDGDCASEDDWEKLYESNDWGTIPTVSVFNRERLKAAKASTDLCDSDPVPHSDLSTINICLEKLEHVLEVYDFPKEYTTKQVLEPFHVYSEHLHLKWIDDTHAAVIFDTPLVARNALSLKHPFLRVRTLSSASTQTLKKLSQFPTHRLQVVKERPATTGLMARRLIAQGLGMKDLTPQETKLRDKKMLELAKAKKQLDKAAKFNAWDAC